MELASANRTYDRLHEAEPFHDGTFMHWSAEASNETPVHYRDGVSIWVAPVDLSPDDKFLTKKRAPDGQRGGEHGDQA